jgi:flavin reductase (DIM6/NTAB) family NADH-FMN oxidoreductase RutF
MPDARPNSLITLDLDTPVWEQVFTVAPLVLIGTLDPDGVIDIAPKHMVMPLGWGRLFGFMCTRRHRTLRNIEREGEFTVTYARPSQVVLASLSAVSPRADDPQPVDPLPMFDAPTVHGSFVTGGYLFLECRLTRVVDGFEDASLIAGEIVAAHVDEAALRSADHDDADLLYQDPLLVYLSPHRYAEVQETRSFPLPTEFKR